MNITFHRVKNLSYIVVDGFFTAGEAEEITQEVQDLKRFSLCAEKTAVAYDEQQTPKKTGTGLCLDDLYFKNREASAILKANRKIFTQEFVYHVTDFDIVFNFLSGSNKDSTLLNYYQEGQQYRPHVDHARISSVTFLREGAFEGGEFSFPEQGVTIDALNNRTVIFPSCATHSALPVHGDGTRISIAQFINYVAN